MTTSKSDRSEAIESLHSILDDGATIYCILRHVSRTGMSRRISFYAMQDGAPRFLDGYIGRAMGLRRPRNSDGLVVNGCGMDMGFHVVSELAHVLDRNLRHEWL